MEHEVNTPTNLPDYEQALKAVMHLPKIYLGQEINTEHGKGIVVELKMKYTGLSVSPEESMVGVWFSIGKSFLSQEQPIYKKYPLNSLREFNTSYLPKREGIISASTLQKIRDLERVGSQVVVVEMDEGSSIFESLLGETSVNVITRPYLHDLTVEATLKENFESKRPWDRDELNRKSKSSKRKK